MNEEAQQFDKTTMLMLRLAGELSDSDNARLERMLAEDPQLRHELESIRQAMDAGLGVLSLLDESEHPLPEGVAQRRATRMLRQWALERKVPQPAQPIVRAPIPWLRYGLATAAMLLVGLTVWGVYHPGRRSPVRMATIPVTKQDQETLLVATLGVGDADDAEDVQTAVPPRLEEMDFVADVSSNRSSVQ